MDKKYNNDPRDNFVSFTDDLLDATSLTQTLNFFPDLNQRGAAPAGRGISSSKVRKHTLFTVVWGVIQSVTSKQGQLYSTIGNKYYIPGYKLPIIFYVLMYSTLSQRQVFCKADRSKKKLMMSMKAFYLYVGQYISIYGVIDNSYLDCQYFRYTFQQLDILQLSRRNF